MKQHKHRGRPGSRQTLPGETGEGSISDHAPAAAGASPRGRTRWRNVRRFAIGLAVIAAVAALFVGMIDTSSGSLTASAQPAHGKALYQQYCVSCHGFDGRGEFNWQYRERSASALDSSGHAWHHEDSQLLEMILDKPLPDSRMPPWRGVLTRADALDVIAYLKTLWTPYIRDNCQGAKHMRCTSTH